MTIFHFQPCLQMGFFLQEAHRLLFLLPIYPLNTLNADPEHTQGPNIKEFLLHHFLRTLYDCFNVIGNYISSPYGLHFVLTG